MADSIARSTEDYLETAISRVRELGSKITDFNDGSGARSVYEAIAAMLAQQSQVAEQLRLDSYLETATGDALTAKALDFQVARKTSVAAQGTVTITRLATGTAVTIPAGWSQLQTIPVPGVPTIAAQTTQDAVFDVGVDTVTVTAAATLGGLAGNIATGTLLLPVNPVDGFQTQGGFVVGASFEGGYDEETDDALRARVPVEVQGRVKGRRESFLAAALRVPGVLSANVLRAGDTRGDTTTVAAGEIDVYFKGDIGLLAAVTSEVANAATTMQGPVTAQAAAERLVAHVTVFTSAGVDTTALAATVTTAICDTVNSLGVGEAAHQSAGIRAIHALTDVLSMSVPFSDFRKFAESSGTAHDMAIAPEKYASLDPADVHVVVTVV